MIKGTNQAEVVDKSMQKKAGDRLKNTQTRRKLLKLESRSWTDSEALRKALSLASPGRDVKPIAARLLRKFKTFGRVVNASRSSLMIIDGISDADIAALEAVATATCSLLRNRAAAKIFDTSEDLKRYLLAKLQHMETSATFILYLDGQRRLIGDEILGRIPADLVADGPREVIRRCLELGAFSFIIAHNHPDGEPTPKWHELALTEELVRAAALFRIVVSDHVIVGSGKTFSFFENGLVGLMTGQETAHPPPGTVLH